MRVSFSEAVDRGSESAEKIRDSFDFDKRILAAEELLGGIEGLGAHTGRYAGISWTMCRSS